jgi:hypothetical protein
MGVIPMIKSKRIALIIGAAVIVIGLLIYRLWPTAAPAQSVKSDPRLGTPEQQESLGAFAAHSDWDLTNDRHPKEPTLPAVPTTTK